MDLEAAAAILGVHYQTAYRWVRNGELPAVRVGAGYELDPEIVETVRLERQRRRGVGGVADTAWDTEIETFVRALTDGDERSARRQLEHLQESGRTAPEVCERLIAPAVRRLDDHRSAGEALAVEVSAGADLCERLIGSMVAPGRGRPRGLAVVTSPAGERHRLPSLMATAALRGNRYRVLHLEGGVPARDLVDYLDETRPDLVVVSVTVCDATAEEFCAVLDNRTTVPLLIGGAGQSVATLLDRVDGAMSAVRARRSAARVRAVRSRARQELAVAVP